MRFTSFPVPPPGPCRSVHSSLVHFLRHLSASAVDLPLRVATRRVLCLFALLTIAYTENHTTKTKISNGDRQWGRYNRRREKDTTSCAPYVRQETAEHYHTGKAQPIESKGAS